MRRLTCAGLAILHVLLFNLAHPPYDLWPLAWAALFPLALLALRCTLRMRAFLITWGVSVLGWLWLQRWMTSVSPAGYIIQALAMGLFPAAFVWLLGMLSSQSLARRRPMPLVIPTAILGPLLWTALEIIRGRIIFGGYTWLLLGQPILHAPIMCQPADLFGQFFISFCTAMPAGLLADFLTMPLIRQERLAMPIRVSLASTVAIFVVTPLYGWNRLREAPTVDSAPVITVAAVQTNVPQDNKLTWTLEEQLRDFAHFVELTRAVDAPRVTRPDLIIWPEAMVPGLGLNAEVIDEIERFERVSSLRLNPGTRYHDELSALAAQVRIPLLVGAAARHGLSLSADPPGPGETESAVTIEEEDTFNSTFLYLPDGRRALDRYDKILLTPFGEMLPYVSAVPALEDLLMNVAARGMSFGLSAGALRTRFRVDLNDATESQSTTTVRIVTPICYEATLPEAVRRLVWESGIRAADLIVNMTNDGWFNDDDGGRFHHLRAAQFRTIENRTPMVRCANTGVSVAIDSSGRILQLGPNLPAVASPQRTEGIMLASIPLDSRITLYAQIGDAFGWACLLVTLSLLALPLALSQESAP